MRMIFSAACLLAIFSSMGGAAAQPAPVPAELVYVPVKPCRAFSTATAGGIIANNQIRPFKISGAASFQAQGGPPGGCGVPAYATAVAISLTSFNATGTGYLKAFPLNDPPPPTQALAFRAGQNITAGTTVGIFAGRINLQALGAATQVVGDVVGYYAQQIQARIFPDGTFRSRTLRVLKVDKDPFDEGFYYVYFDRHIEACSVSVTSEISGHYATISSYNVNSVTVTTGYYAISNGSIVNEIRDIPFSIAVNC